MCGEQTEEELQPIFSVNNPVVRTYGETTAGTDIDQSQQQQHAPSLNSTMASETSQEHDVSMNISASTPIKVFSPEE